MRRHDGKREEMNHHDTVLHYKRATSCVRPTR